QAAPKSGLGICLDGGICTHDLSVPTSPGMDWGGLLRTETPGQSLATTPSDLPGRPRTRYGRAMERGSLRSGDVEEPAKRLADDHARRGVISLGTGFDRGSQFGVDPNRDDIGGD